MTADRITKIKIAGLRALADVELEVRGLRVLIGDNGTGKSTLLEAFELLRLAAKPGLFVRDGLNVHGGLAGILTRGQQELLLGVEIEGAGSLLTYSFGVALLGTEAKITHEALQSVEPGTGVTRDWLVRDGAQPARFLDVEGRTISIVGPPPLGLILSSLGITGTPSVRRMIDALSRIECHFPFETRPLWQQQELDVRSGPRWPVPYERHDRVARYGTNLASCIQTLRNGPGDSWERLLARARLGLGEDLRDLTPVASGRGNVEVELLFGAWPDRPLPVQALSEGQLSYLLMVAMFELGRDRSVLLFDEPELHLHPELLARVVQMFEDASKSCPVILATHSDQLLDALDDPAGSVVLAERGETGVEFRHPNSGALAQWMDRYRGLGTIRHEGYEKHVFAGGLRDRAGQS